MEVAEKRLMTTEDVRKQEEEAVEEEEEVGQWDDLVQRKSLVKMIYLGCFEHFDLGRL